MKRLATIISLWLIALTAFGQNAIETEKVTTDSTRYNTVLEIPGCPTTGMVTFYYRDTLRAIDSTCTIYNLNKQRINAAAGVNGQVQFNYAGDLGSDTSFYYDRDMKWLWIPTVVATQVLAITGSFNETATDSVTASSHVKIAYRTAPRASTNLYGQLWVKGSDQRLRYTDDGGWTFEATLPGQQSSDSLKFLMTNGTTADWVSIPIPALFDSLYAHRDTLTDHAERIVKLERFANYDIRNATTWASSEHYDVNDIVGYVEPTYLDRLYFICKTAHNSTGASPYDADGAKWKQLFWQKGFYRHLQDSAQAGTTGWYLKDTLGVTQKAIHAYLAANHYSKTEANALYDAKLDTTKATLAMRNNWTGAAAHKTTEDALNGLVKVSSGTYSAITDNSNNWNTAFGWGNHAGLYSTLVQWGTKLDTTAATYLMRSHWNSAYGWGNHALAGYVTGTPWTAVGYWYSGSHPTTLSGYGITDASASNHNHTGVYDPLNTASGLFTTHNSTYNHANIAHGETAYGWGNHAGLYITWPLNNVWYTSKDYAGNTANLFKYSSENTIVPGGPVEISELWFPANGGLMNIMNMPITPMATDNAEYGYLIKLGGQNWLKMSGLYNAAGDTLDNRKFDFYEPLWFRGSRYFRTAVDTLDDERGMTCKALKEFGDTRWIGGTGGSGEINTASNVGTGAGVFKTKSTYDLIFKTLKTAIGSKISITANTDDISFDVDLSGKEDAGTASGLFSSHNSTYNHGNIAHGETAYGWGNHASAGYVTGTPWTAVGYWYSGSHPTTLSGYGITDASASNHNHTGVYDPLNTASGLFTTHNSTYNHDNIAHGETAYGWGNHAGLYISSPLNNAWYTSKDYAGNVANLFKFSSENTIVPGGPVEIDQLWFPANAGVRTVMNMPVTPMALDNEILGYEIKLGSQKFIEMTGQYNAAADSVDNFEFNVRGALKINGVNVTSIFSAAAHNHLGVYEPIIMGDGNTKYWRSDKTWQPFPTFNQNTSGYAESLKSPATTGLVKITGMGAGSTRTKTVRDADDQLLELGGSYTPIGAWDWTSATVTWPAGLTADTRWDGGTGAWFNAVNGRSSLGLGTAALNNTGDFATAAHNHSGIYDPINTASGLFTTHNSTYNHANIAHGETAYGWGNHALAGYVTGTPWTAIGYWYASNHPTTLAGYGITDASASNHSHPDAVSLGASGFLTGADKYKLNGIAPGAEVNTNADWNASSGDAQIFNKPTIPVVLNNASAGTNPADWAGDDTQTISRKAFVAYYDANMPAPPANSVVTYTVKKTITAANLRLFGSAGYEVELVPAYPAGTINVSNVMAVLDYTSGAYWSENGAYLRVYCLGATDDIYVSNSSFYCSNSDDAVDMEKVVVTPGVNYKQYVQNRGIWIKASANLSGATVTSPINIYITYTLTTL